MEKKDDKDQRSAIDSDLDDMDTPVPVAKKDSGSKGAGGDAPAADEDGGSGSREAETGASEDAATEPAVGEEKRAAEAAASVDEDEIAAESPGSAAGSDTEAEVKDRGEGADDQDAQDQDAGDQADADTPREIDYDEEPTIDLGERGDDGAVELGATPTVVEEDDPDRELVAVDLADHIETHPLTFHEAGDDDVVTDAQQQLEPILVQVEGLIKHYGPVRAVDGIDMVVRRGDVLAFLGPNGAGKTTAMKMITGFLEPDAGSVVVCGYDVAHDSLAARRRIGYLPENAPSYGDMTPRSFLRFIAEVRGLEGIPSKIDAVVARTGLESVIDRAIDNLSKGFKRRVGLAQALIHDPEILILDEPTDGLDPNQKLVVQDLISSLSAEKSIVVSTHILDEAERICNRAIILSEGKILVDSTPDELLLKAPLHNVIKIRFERQLPQRVLGRVREVEWCESAALLEDGTLLICPRDGRNHLHHVLAQLEGEPVADIRLIEGRLEDLFREITKGVAA